STATARICAADGEWAASPSERQWSPPSSLRYSMAWAPPSSLWLEKAVGEQPTVSACGGRGSRHSGRGYGGCTVFHRDSQVTPASSDRNMPAMRCDIGSLLSILPKPVLANRRPALPGCDTITCRSGLPPGSVQLQVAPPSLVDTTPPTSTPTLKRC